MAGGIRALWQQCALQGDVRFDFDLGGDGLPPDATVTERYVQALDHGLSSVRTAGARNALNTKLVMARHGILMQDAPAHVRAGQYRTTQAWIGSGRIEDAIFVPAPPDRIVECMQELEQSMLQYSP